MSFLKFLLVLCFFNFYLFADSPDNLDDNKFCGPGKVVKIGYFQPYDTGKSYYIKFKMNIPNISNITKRTFKSIDLNTDSTKTNLEIESRRYLLFLKLLLASYATNATISVGRHNLNQGCSNNFGTRKDNSNVDYILLSHGIRK